MALQIRDANGAVQVEPIWIDNVYRAAGVVVASDTADGKDFLLITASATGVTRLLKAKFALQGAGTASTAISVLSMNRTTAAPTGNTPVAVTLTQHNPSAAAAGSTVKTEPQSSQTAAAGATVLGNVYVGVADTAFTVSQYEIPCGPEARQQAIIIPQSGFVTFRLTKALPGSSAISFDIEFSESAV